MRKSITGLLLLSSLFLAGILIGGCKNTNDKQREETEKVVAEANRQVGMPNIVHFTERKLMKRLYEIRDQENLVMHAYLVSLNGDLIYLFPCMGYGLPYTTQFTNPMARDANSSAITLPQPEPNGLFMPEQAEGTWLMMIASDGTIHPVYVEPRVIVSPVKLPNAKHPSN